MNWRFWKSRRQARYVFRLPLAVDLLDQEMAYDVLARWTPIITAREFNKLPPDLQRHFVKVGK